METHEGSKRPRDDADDEGPAKRRRIEPTVTEYDGAELASYELEPGVHPEDADLLRKLIAFAVETIGNARVAIRARDVGPPKYSTRVMMPTKGGGPPLYYDVTVSYEPAVVVKYEHQQALMDQSVGRVANLYTRIDPRAVRQELGFRFYSLTRPPPKPFSVIDFTSVRRRFAVDEGAAQRPAETPETPSLGRRLVRSLSSVFGRKGGNDDDMFE